jgi:hypothetical protein
VVPQQRVCHSEQWLYRWTRLFDKASFDQDFLNCRRYNYQKRFFHPSAIFS